MLISDLTDYDYNIDNLDLASFLSVEQHTNKNDTIDTFFNLNDGVTVEGIDELSSNDIKIYTCKNGDDLRLISYDNYGTISYWWLIAKINNIEDSLEQLKAGQKIKLLSKMDMNHIFSLLMNNKK